MNHCQLDHLPVELIHHLFSYFSAHEIFYTFINVTSYIDAVLATYSNYTVNLKSITRTNFDLICQHIISDQVIALTLSDDENTPGLVELFLSHFQINQFTRLQSLRLIEIGADFWEPIITKLVELKNLRSFSFFPSNRENPWVFNIHSDDVTQLDKRLFDSYAPVLSQLYRLRLCHGDFLKSVQFLQLRHLILERSSADVIKHICSVAPQLKSLDTTITDIAVPIEFIYPLTQLKRLILQLQDRYFSMNDMEQMMSNLPYLQHLELTANCNNDVVNGERWQMKLKSLITFKFMFNLSVHLQSEDLDSFRTSFWLEEKRWYVGCRDSCLFSVPDFAEKETDEDFLPPSHSTVPDNAVFYKCINSLQLKKTPSNTNDYFTDVQTLIISYLIPSSTIRKVVNVCEIQHLILSVPMKNVPLRSFINDMPNLRKISIKRGIKDFLKQVRWKTIEKIQTLEIGHRYRDPEDYNLEKLSSVFSNIKHLGVNHLCSATQIFDFLDRFKHLSTASFHYVSILADDEIVPKHRLKIQSDLDRIRRRQRLNYTYRFDSSSVHIWIR